MSINETHKGVSRKIKSWRLKEFRKSKSLTIPQFAKTLNLEPVMIFMYEAGIKRPDESFWSNLFKTFNVTHNHFHN